MALDSVPAFVVVVALHLALRERPWIHEWYWTLDSYAFVTVLLAPLVGGVAAWEGARWAGSEEYLRSTGRTGAGLSAAWIPSALCGTAAYVAGLAVAAVIAARAGAPGFPSLPEVLSSVPALALLVGGAMTGASIGWASKRALASPIVAVVVFGVLLSGYTVLPEKLLRIGGATATLIALEPRTTVHLLQAALYLSVGAAALGIVQYRSEPALPSRALAAGSLVIASGTAIFLSVSPGMRFSETPVEVTCRGARPIVCLSPSYESLRASIAAMVSDPFERFARAGFAPPERLTQDVTDDGGKAHVIGIGPMSVEDVASILTFSIIPEDCDIFRDRATYRRYLDVVYWVEALLGIRVGEDPTVSPEVQAGDTPAARDWIRDVQGQLSACTA